MYIIIAIIAMITIITLAKIKKYRKNKIKLKNHLITRNILINIK